GGAAVGRLVIVPWTIGDLLHALTARGEHPAVISVANDSAVTWGSKTLAEQALTLLILTTRRHIEAGDAILRTRNVFALRIDEDRRRGQNASARRLAATRQADDLPASAADAPAMLSWTSGTTGSPKAFVLTHFNIASNVEALQQLAVVGQRDRALLPLPLP